MAVIGTETAAVATLQVQGASGTVGAPTTPTEEEEPIAVTHSVTVGAEAIAVATTSASTVSSFALNEESKTVSFMTDGSGSETTVNIGAILEGPYTVMIDGEESTDFEESTSEDGVSTISVPHASGAHEVMITGTQVVPEFPVALLGVLAATVGLVAVVGRSRIFSH